MSLPKVLANIIFGYFMWDQDMLNFLVSLPKGTMHYVLSAYICNGGDINAPVSSPNDVYASYGEYDQIVLGPLLACAVRLNNTDLMSVLLDLGASPDAVFYDGVCQTPLSLAFCSNFKSCKIIYARVGGNLNHEFSPSFHCWSDNGPNPTLLSKAVKRKWDRRLSWLIENGVDLWDYYPDTEEAKHHPDVYFDLADYLMDRKLTTTLVKYIFSKGYNVSPKVCEYLINHNQIEAIIKMVDDSLLWGSILANDTLVLFLNSYGYAIISNEVVHMDDPFYQDEYQTWFYEKEQDTKKVALTAVSRMSYDIQNVLKQHFRDFSLKCVGSK